MKNKMEDLRNHLFATLEALQDEEKPMDLDRAGAIVDVAQTLIDSAKVEVAFLKVVGEREGARPSAFLASAEPKFIPAKA